MDEYFGYCSKWPAVLKEAWQKQNKLRCRRRCLEAYLDRIDYTDFDGLFAELEQIEQQLHNACSEFEALYRKYG